MLFSDVNECDFNFGSGPCANGAICLDTEGSFACICGIGWSGELCTSKKHKLQK